LRDNVCLDGCDVAILDYGLTPQQRAGIDSQGAIRFARPRDGFVNNLRFRDLAALLGETHYDQVMLIDSGDVIFQADISDVFHRNQDMFRAVCEEKYTAQYEYFISTSDFKLEDYKHMVKSLRGKLIVNTGVIAGPGYKFRALWRAARDMVLHMQNWGTLQLVLNYLLYSDGFVELPPRYNFVLMTAKSKYRIRGSRFYDGAGQLIPLVHNAGGSDKLRFVSDFGYGPGRNRPRRIMPLLLGGLFFGIECWRSIPFIHGKAGKGRVAEAAAGRPHAPVAAPHLPLVDSPVAGDHATPMPR
jgi:hypothetical protein